MRVSFVRAVVLAAAGAAIALLVLLPSRVGSPAVQGNHAISVPRRAAPPAVHLAAESPATAWVHPSRREPAPAAHPAKTMPPAPRTVQVTLPSAAELASARPATTAAATPSVTVRRPTAKARTTVRSRRFRALRRILGPHPVKTAPKRQSTPAPEQQPVQPEVTALADSLAPAASTAPAPSTPTATPDESPNRGVHIHWLHRK